VVFKAGSDRAITLVKWGKYVERKKVTTELADTIALLWKGGRDAARLRHLPLGILLNTAICQQLRVKPELVRGCLRRDKL